MSLLSVPFLGITLGAPPRFDSPVVLPDRSVELRLAGESGSAYSIEVSQNLSSWLFLTSGIETNGVLSIHHAAASNYPALFYRAKGVDDSLPSLTVGPKPNTNAVVSTLASLQGSSALLYGSDGTQFTLNLPSNSIPDATIITMTLVTNITGLPFARGTLGAVQIDPPNLALWSAASLEILFPTNIYRREVISYFCQADGSSFQLTPDRVGTNRIVIPVTHLGTFGSSLCTTQELAAAARIQIGSGRLLSVALPTSRPGLLSAAAASTSCVPGDQALAEQVGAEIAQARAEREKEIAALLGAERQRERQDDSADSAATLEKVSAAQCEFYKSEIAPRWPLAEQNCAVAKLLVLNTLSLIRQQQLMGADDDCISMANIPMCPLLNNCLAEIRECCTLGKKGPQKITEVLSLERQDQLLGSNCISPAEAQEVIDLCSSNSWSGTFSMVGASARVMTTTPVQGIVVTDTIDFSSRFDGVVEVSEETGAPGFGSLVELRVVGQLIHRDFHNTTSDSSSQVDHCPNDKPGGTEHTITISQTEQNIAATTAFLVSFILPSNAGFELLHAENYDSADPNWAPATGSLSLLNHGSIDNPCTGLHILKNETLHFDKSPLTAAHLPETSGSMTDPNTVSGSFSLSDPAIDPPVKYEFKWSFTRQKGAP